MAICQVQPGILQHHAAAAVKFNLVSFSITLLQLALANLLPLIFDAVTAKLPPVMRPVFRPDTLFERPSPYVVDGVVTWGYVLPFFLSNFIANIYGYFMNMKTTFRGKGSRRGEAGEGSLRIC